MKFLYLSILIVCSYLFGNINFAKIISRCKKDDITKHGSGNPGTLNMLRTFGFKWAILNLTLEICKGAIPTLVGKLVFKQFDMSQIAMYSAGVSVILGHIFPIVFKFKGGKGVAAFAGFSLIALPWWVFLIIFAACFTFVVITSIGSIGTLGFVLISTIVQLFLIDPSSNGWVCYAILLFTTTLIMYVHRGNIKRLFAGKENPTNIRAAFKKDFGKKSKAEDSDTQILVLKEEKSEASQGLDSNSGDIKEVEAKVNILSVSQSGKLDETQDLNIEDRKE